MERFNHHVAIKVNRWGKGLLGECVQIEEYDHVYFGENDDISDAYRTIDRLLRAGKREDITVSIYEGGEAMDTIVRRLFVRMDAGYRQWGTIDVAVCDAHGCFSYDDFRQMDKANTKHTIVGILHEVAEKQKKSVA